MRWEVPYSLARDGMKGAVQSSLAFRGEFHPGMRWEVPYSLVRDGMKGAV